MELENDNGDVSHNMDNAFLDSLSLQIALSIRVVLEADHLPIEMVEWHIGLLQFYNILPTDGVDHEL